jgi:zinc transport system substrate-binding protein
VILKENLMNPTRRTRGVIAAAFVLACSADDPVREQAAERDTSTLLIYSVNYPLAYFAQRIGEGDVSVVFPAPPNIDPADWVPAPDEVAAFQSADLILLNGSGHAEWVERASLPQSKVLDTSASFRDRLIELRGDINHTHGPGGAHVHAGTAATTWLDPLLAIEQARAIAAALARIRPERSAGFTERFAVLETDLHRLDAGFAEAAEAVGEAPVLFSHPVYQYFERRYRVIGESVHWEPDELPTPEMWRDLDSMRSDHPSRLMIWEATPEEETMRRLDLIGVSSVVLAPCANTPEEGDWMAVMFEGAAHLNEAVSQLAAGD